ncbi:hypothetical protein QQ045_033515 [Rhodiola kirilowii]
MAVGKAALDVFTKEPPPPADIKLARHEKSLRCLRASGEGGEDEATKVVRIQKPKKEFALFETGPFEPLVLSSEGDLPVVQVRFWQLSFSRKRWVWKPVVAGGTDSLHSLMTLDMGSTAASASTSALSAPSPWIPQRPHQLRPLREAPRPRRPHQLRPLRLHVSRMRRESYPTGNYRIFKKEDISNFQTRSHVQRLIRAKLEIVKKTKKGAAALAWFIQVV